MPLVQSFDGLNRRIYLSSEVVDAEWDPIDVFKEYLTERRDNHDFRKWSPLIKMVGGQPKTPTTSQPRLLQVLTDDNGLTCKLVFPDTGPYRSKVTGEVSTDIPETDAEAFDITMMTTAVIIDYKPPEAEVLKVDTGSGLSPQEATTLNSILQLMRANEEKNAQNNKYYKRDEDTNAVILEKDYAIDGNDNETLTKP